MAILDSSKQQLTRDKLAEQYMDLINSAKKEIIVIAGEFLTLGYPAVMDSLIEKIRQGISVIIYIYDIEPERKKIDELISCGAKVFQTQDYSKDHYLVVDNKDLSYHSHKRYNDALLRDEEVTEEDRNKYEKQLNAVKCNAHLLCDLLGSPDDISSKRINFIYNIEMALGGAILVSTAIFYKVLGLMAIPMIIFGLGIFFTSFILKRKIKEMRKVLELYDI
jgi:ubiquitin